MGEKLKSAARAIADNAYDEDGPLPALRNALGDLADARDMRNKANARMSRSPDFTTGTSPSMDTSPAQAPDSKRLNGISDYSSGGAAARRDRESGS